MSTLVSGASLRAALGWRRPRCGWRRALDYAAVATVALLAWAMLSAAALRAAGVGLDPCDGMRGTGLVQAPLAALATVVLAVPTLEETLFRGLLFGALRRRLALMPAVTLAAVLFAAAHGTIALFLPMLGAGAVLCLLYERTGSVWPGVLAHGAYNLVGLLPLLIAASC